MGEAGDIEPKLPLWLDCDPGHDDAFAILLAAFHPSLELLGISTVHGNASLQKTTTNALSVLEAIGRPRTPVFPGAARAFCRENEYAPNIHGESGLAGTDLLPPPERSALTYCNTITDMRDALLSCEQGTASLVATGPLTNVALLFATFPALVRHIRGLSIMGGSVGNGYTSAPLGNPFVDAQGKSRPRIGNTTPYAEFNIHCDAEAAQSIFSNPELSNKTTLITLDLSHQAFATAQIQARLLGKHAPGSKPTRLRKMFNELLMFFAHTYADVFGLTEGPPLHDPLAVAVLLVDHAHENCRIDFNDWSGERWNVSVELEGDQRGRTVVKSADKGVRIPRGMNLPKFWDALNECMAMADQTTSWIEY